MYCARPTDEPPLWQEGIPGLISPQWVYAHATCEKLSWIAMEDSARKKCAKAPEDLALRFVAEFCERIADRLCRGN